MKGTLSAGFLFLGSVLFLLLGFFPVGGILTGLLILLALLSGLLLTCQTLAACCHSIIAFVAFCRARLPGLKAAVTPPPSDDRKDDPHDDPSQ